MKYKDLPKKVREKFEKLSALHAAQSTLVGAEMRFDGAQKDREYWAASLQRLDLQLDWCGRSQFNSANDPVTQKIEAEHAEVLAAKTHADAQFENAKTAVETARQELKKVEEIARPYQLEVR